MDKALLVINLMYSFAVACFILVLIVDHWLVLNYDQEHKIDSILWIGGVVGLMAFLCSIVWIGWYLC